MAEKKDTRYVGIFYHNKYSYATENIEIQSKTGPKIKLTITKQRVETGTL